MTVPLALARDNRWGNFWSFGASWRISKEDFMENLTWVDNLKLRASYGETGNDAIYYTDDDTQQDTLILIKPCIIWVVNNGFGSRSLLPDYGKQ